MDGSESGGHAVAIGGGIRGGAALAVADGAEGVAASGRDSGGDDLAGLAGWLSRLGDGESEGDGKWDQIG